MSELEAAYARVDELTTTLRRVRGEIETTTLFADPSDEAILVDCLGLIDESLADRVVA